MNSIDFLSQLLPSTGFIVVATPTASGKGYTQKVHTNISDAVTYAQGQLWKHRDVFFALATFEKEQVWNPNVRNYDGTMGKFQIRTQANAKALRSLFLDLDIDAAPDEVKALTTFTSKPEAAQELRQLCKKVGLPKPMVVDSGGGLHCYWPFKEEVPAGRWREIAAKFKAICLHEKFRIDPAVPADSARVLRLLGTSNFKKDTARPVTLLAKAHGCYEADVFDSLFTAYIEAHNVPMNIKKAGASIGNPAPFSELGDNLGSTNDPLNPDRMAFHCPAFAALLADRGASASEPLWYHGLSLAKFSENADDVMLAISDAHPGFDLYQMREKASRWPAPVTCNTMHEKACPSICDACPNLGKINSPASFGRVTVEAAPPVITTTQASDGSDTTTTIELPQPPAPYVRHKGTIVIKSEDKDGREVIEEICPFDMYPTKVLRQASVSGEVRESTMWNLHLDRLGLTTVEILPAVFADTRRLQTFLMEKGGYPTQSQVGKIQTFMSAYVRELNKVADRERTFERLGWHDGNKSFVLGTQVIHADGKFTEHPQSRHVKAVTKEGLGKAGTLQGWKDALRFYDDPMHAPSRVFIYQGFGAPLFLMTGHKGVLMNASGDTGRGKTTALEASASIWGHPNKLHINGNKDGTTNNALIEILGTYHSLPVYWDDITQRSPEETLDFMLNVSQGKGKERMKGSEHNGRVVEWGTIVASTANTDQISRALALNRDSNPHLMRFINVDFGDLPGGTEAKIAADRFKRALTENYGHAAPVYMQYVTANYELVKSRVIANNEMVDRMVNADAHERFWTAAVAALYTGAQIAKELGLIAYDVESDLQWMLQHFHTLRTAMSDAISTPLDILTEFLETHISNTLVVSAKSTSNIDNVAVRPFGSLLVRHDLDYGFLFISRTAINEYCLKVKANFKKLETTLIKQGVIKAKAVQKVLGADTNYAKGFQTRCWQIDANQLGPAYQQAISQAVAAQQALGTP